MNSMRAWRRIAEIMIKTDHAVYFGAGEVERFGDCGNRARRNITHYVLHAVQNRQKCAGFMLQRSNDLLNRLGRILLRHVWLAFFLESEYSFRRRVFAKYGEKFQMATIAWVSLLRKINIFIHVYDILEKPIVHNPKTAIAHTTNYEKFRDCRDITRCLTRLCL